MVGLAEPLAKYYKRVSGSVIFVNGMHLSQLALAMFEIDQSVDASVLSRVINGKRLFTYSQLNAFCQILALGITEKYSLEQVISRDILKRNKINPISLNEALISDTTIIVAALQTLRNSGNLRHAIRLAGLFERNIHKPSQLLPILNEKVRSIGLLSKADVALTLSKETALKAIDISEEFGNQIDREFALMNLGGVLYVGKSNQESQDFLSIHYKNVSDQMKPQFIRTMLLNSSIIGNKARFFGLQKTSEKLFNKISDINSKVSLLEATARGLCILGHDVEAIDYLDQASDFYSSSSPFYQSQLLRGKMTLLTEQQKRGKLVDLDRAKEILGHYDKPIFKDMERHKRQVQDLFGLLKC